MAQELSNAAIFNRVANFQAAGVTAVTTSVVDMSGFDAVSFVCELDTVVSGCVLQLTAYENTTNSNSGGTAISNAAAGLTAGGASSNGVLVVDVIRPKNRYVYATLTRTTQNATVDSIMAIQYRARNLPVSQPTSVLAQQLSTPEV